MVGAEPSSAAATESRSRGNCSGCAPSVCPPPQLRWARPFPLHGSSSLGLSSRCLHPSQCRRRSRSLRLPPLAGTDGLAGAPLAPAWRCSSPRFLHRANAFSLLERRRFGSPTSTVHAGQRLICLPILHCLVGLSLTFAYRNPVGAFMALGLNPLLVFVALRPVRLAYQPPASSTFLSEQISCQQSARISTSHQPSAKRTGC
jgi:hypothetical protein